MKLSKKYRKRLQKNILIIFILIAIFMTMLAVCKLAGFSVSFKKIGEIINKNINANETITTDETTETSEMAEETNDNVINCESIMQGIRDNDLADGEYILRVTGLNDDVIDYKVELINYYDDVVYTENTSLGDSTTDYKMLVVKYHKNLTINSGVTVTATNVSNLTYKKGMYLCVIGELKNSGTITMTARGTYNCAGENVYLWKNKDSNYEYVPQIGGIGGIGVSMSVGNAGKVGNARSTGGGGSGGSTGTSAKAGGNGGSGTSYSGGSGGGGTYHTTKAGTYKGGDGSSIGGPGGAGAARSNSSSSISYGCGGAGNLGGAGAYATGSGSNAYANAGTYAENGTGGLLVIYADQMNNSGTISSNGSNVNGKRYASTSRYAGGGGSGGGSINIFANKTVNKGNLSATGGVSTVNTSGITYAIVGSKGGAGSITYNELKPFLNYSEKSIIINLNNKYNIDKNKIKLINQNDVQTGILTLGDINYEILDKSIATISDEGVITGVSEGSTKVKIIDKTNELYTYVYLTVKEGSVPDIQGGKNFTVALKKNGTVWSYGINTLGQLGVGSNSNELDPVRIKELENIKQISTGYSHSVVLSEEGKIYTWGANNVGQLGDGTTDNSSKPIEVNGLSNIIKVDAYKNISVALSSDGKIYAWGDGYSSIPMRIIISERIVDISGELLLTDSGKVINIKDTSTIISGLNQIAKISCGSDHYLALSVNGVAYSWGNNSTGELGITNTTGEVKSIASEILEISAGLDTSIILNENGEVYACGQNTNGQIGIGKSTATTLTKIDGIDKIEKVSAGEGTHCAIIDEFGFVWTTGLNTYGELGFGNNTNSTVFTKLGKTILTSNIEKEYLDIDEQKTFNLVLENTFNLKIDLIDNNPDNFEINVPDATKLKLEEKTITALDYGKSIITITHIPTENTKEIEINVVIKMDSIVQGVRDTNLSNGKYDIMVKDELYSAEVYNEYEDIQYSLEDGQTARTVALGDDTPDETMLIVKYHKNLTIDKGVTLTSTVRKKGMYVCVLGNTHNNGNISMTARGASAEGQNVYLWKNINDTYEYVPETGAKGGLGVSDSRGNAGTTGTNRQTGGGGSGASNGTKPKAGGDGGAGTSYSGGAGGGGTYHTSGTGTYRGSNGSSTGGAGGYGAVRGNSYKTYASGGSGNEPGAGAYSTGNAYANAGTYGQSGTGGLLILYTDNLYNTGSISSKGSDNKAVRYSSTTRCAGGGASGGGSINIFANKVNLYTSIDATGGISTLNKSGITYGTAGSNGGNGSVTINELGSELVYADKSVNIQLSDIYTIEKSKLSIVKLNDIQTGSLTMGNVEYQIEDTSIANIENDKIIPIKQGKTKLKIVDTTNNLTTYMYIEVTNGVFSKISIGDTHTVALKANGTVWSFGQNTYGQLGNGTTENKNEAIQVLKENGDILENIIDIDAKEQKNVAVNSSGKVYTWGLVKLGQNTENQLCATEVTELNNIVNVTIFNNNFIALNREGEVYIFGDEYEQPIKIEVTEKMVEISGNKMLSESGRVYDISAPTVADQYLKNIVKISASKTHSIALDANGNVYSVGTGTKGALGNGGSVTTTIPVLVKTSNGEILSNIAEISAGSECSMALSFDGKVYVWGDNTNKKIGIESTNTNVATLIEKVQDKEGNILQIEKMERVSAGTNNTAIVDEFGYVYTVGLGTSGQLGTNDNVSRNIYTKIGEISIITIPDNIKVKIGETKDITIILSNLFNLKTDIINSELSINNTNKNVAEISKKINVNNSNIINKDNANSNYEIKGNKLGNDIIVVKDKNNTYSKNVNINVISDNNGDSSADAEVGDGFTILLKSDGTIWSNGKNNNGELGTGNNENKNIPTKVELSEKIDSISVGNSHCLAIGKSGKVYSFGLNTNGQLGIGNTTTKKAPVEISNLINIVKVKAIGNTSFAINNEGKLYAWGEGYTKLPVLVSIDANIIDIGKKYYLADDGIVRSLKDNTQISLSLRQTSETEKIVIESEKIVQISEGEDHLLLLGESGKIYTYGSNIYGQLGDGTTVGKVDGISTATKLNDGNLLKNVIEVSAGDRYSMALTSNGLIYTWGINGSLQLGTDNMQESYFAILQEDMQNVAGIQAGINHTVVFKNDGNTYSWGEGSSGELGNGSNNDYSLPQLVGKNIIETNTNNVILEVGETANINGNLNCFNLFKDINTTIEYESKDTSIIMIDTVTGELIALKEGRTTVIVKEKDGLKISVVQIKVLDEGTTPENSSINIEPKSVTSGKHTLALKVDGTVWSYGQNNYGQLGIGTTESSDNPLKVDFGNNVKIIDIACGDEHSMALDSDGNVYTWGRNNYYQLGNSVDTYSSEPKKLTEISDIIKISSGNSNCFAISKEKEVYAWGLNSNGECGTGSYTNRISITKAKYLTDVIDIKSGKNHTLALKSTGEVWATGSNLYGELGLGNDLIRKVNVFKRINSISDIVGIGTGDSNCIAVKQDGSIYTWGSSLYGALGYESNQTNMPAYVEGIKNIRYVSGGKGYTLLIDSNENVYVSGLNNLGQLGINNKDNQAKFTKVSTIEKVTNVDGGNGYTVFTKRDGTVWATGDYNQSDESLNSKTKGMIPIRVGNDETGFPDDEVTITVNEEKNIINQYMYEFNLIKLDDDINEILEISSVNEEIMKVNESNVYGVRVGKTWAKIANTKENKEYVIRVNVIAENYNVAPIVATGEDFAAVLKADGTIWSYGYNSNGELADGTNISKDIPNKTNILSTYKDIVAGKSFLVALRNDNTVWIVGDNSNGQLGQKNNISRNKLIQISDVKNVRKIAAGDKHVIALDNNGVVYGWGRNTEGQLGQCNINKNTNYPIALGSISERIIDISAGLNQSILITASGKVYGFGKILNGYLTGLENAQKVQVGDGYLLILTKEGNIYEYENGVLSIVLNSKDAIDISLNKNTNMYQSIDEKTYAWGKNEYGQLGINSTQNIEVPVQVNEHGENTFGISAGYNNTYIIENTGSIYAAGKNEYGTLGNSTRIDSEVHTLVGNRTFEILPKTKIMTVNDIENVTIESDTFNVFNQIVKDALEYNWTSSNTDIVSVIDGEFTANSEGASIITATDKITGEEQTAERYVVPIEKQRIKKITVNTIMSEVSGEMEYDVKVITDDNSGILTVETNDESDEISLDKEDFSDSGTGKLIKTITLEDKITKVPIYVKISNGTILEYILNAEKISNDVSIEKILLDGVQAKPVSLTRYEAVINEETTVVLSDVISKNEYASVSIDGKQYELGEQTKNLVIGTQLSKIIKISIKAESGVEQEYTLVIYKKSELGELEKLTVNEIDATRIGESKYSVVIDNNLTNVNVYAKAISSLVEVNLNNSDYIIGITTQTIETKEDVTFVSINVRISEDEIKEYILEIHKKDDSKLDMVMVNGNILKSNKNVYEVYLPSTETEATVKAIASDKNNYIQIDSDEKELTESECIVQIPDVKNEYSIKVIDAEGQQTEYTLVIKKAEADVTLKNIQISNGDYERDIEIKENSNEYEIRVPNSFTNVELTAITGYINSKVKIDSGEYETYKTSKNINLIDNLTTVLVTVQSEDGMYTGEYSIKITKMSSNTNISKIMVDDEEAVLEIDGKYHVNLSEALTSVNTCVIAEEELASIKINSSSYELGKINQEIIIDSKTNNSIIYVKAEDGTVKEYELIIEGLSDNINISKVVVNGTESVYRDGEDYYEIRSDDLNYNIEVTAEDSCAKIIFENGVEGVGVATTTAEKQGKNTIVNFKLVSQNGLETVGYKIIIKEKSSNAEIDIVAVNDNIVNSDAVGNYKATVTHDIEELEITGIAEDENAILSIDNSTDNTSKKTIKSKMLATVMTYQINVQAEDGTTQTKELKVEKLDGNVNLKYLKVGETSDALIDATLLDNGTYYYKTNRLDSVFVQATAESETTKVKINENETVLESKISNINTEGEITNVSITLTAEDSTVNTYFLKIEKISNDATIKDIQGEKIQSKEINDDEIKIIVDEDVTSLDLKCITTSDNAKIKIEGEETFENNVMNRTIDLSGYTEDGIGVNIVVQAEDSVSEKTYLVKIYKNAILDIKNISVNNEIATYDEGLGKYYKVINADGAAYITVTAEQITQTVSILNSDGTSVLATGVGTVTLNTTQTNQLQDYIIRITSHTGLGDEESILTIRKKSQETGIVYVKVDGLGTIKESDTLYNTNVSGKDIYTVEIKAKDENAKVKIENNEYSKTQILTDKISIADGETKTFNITVKSENGEEQNYQLVVTRISSSTDIDQITVTDIEESTVEGETISTNVEKQVTNYDESTKTYKVIVTKDLVKTTISVNAKSEFTNITLDLITSGDGTVKMDKILNGVGITEIPINLIAADGTEETRYLQIIQLSNDIGLELVEVDGIELNKNEIGNYETTLTDENDFMTVRAKTSNIKSKVRINNTGDGIESENTIKVAKGNSRKVKVPIEVTAEDGTTYTYELIVNVISHNSETEFVTIDNNVAKDINGIYESFIKYDAKSVKIVIKSKVEYSIVKQGNLENKGVLEFTYNIDDLQIQNYTIPYTIIAEDGTEKNYEIKLTRKSTNNSIQEVYVNDNLIEEDENGNYYATVVDGDTSAKIKLIAEENYAISQIEESINIKTIEKEVDISSNEKIIQIPIKVTSQSGSENLRYIYLEKISNNKNVSYVKVDDEELTKKDEIYTKYIYETVNSVKLDIATENQYSKITIYDKENNIIKEQSNNLICNIDTINQSTELTLRITAENGDYEESKIIIEKMSVDTSIKELYVDGSLVEPNEENKYVVKVLDTINYTNVKVITNNQNAYARILLGKECLNVAEEKITLSEEKENVVPIIIRSQSGITKATYLYIERISTSNKLNELKVDNKEAEFNELTKKYCVVVEKGKTEYELFATTESDYAIIEYDGFEYSTSLRTIIEMPTDLEATNINIKVKSESGSEENYIVELIRESDDTSLEYLKVDDKIVNLVLGTSDTYSAMIKKSATSAKVEVKTTTGYAQIQIGDNTIIRSNTECIIECNLQENNIIVPIIIKAADGKTVKTYNLIIYRGNDNTDVTLKVNEEEVNINDDGDYNVSILDTYNEVDVVAILADSTGKVDINATGNFETPQKKQKIQINGEKVKKIPIVIISEDGTRRENTLTITVISTNANTSNVIGIENINNVDVEKNAIKDIDENFVLKIKSTTEKLKLKIKSSDSNATITSGTQSNKDTLEFEVQCDDVTFISYTVLAEDGITSKNETIKITKQSANTDIELSVECETLTENDNNQYQKDVLGGTTEVNVKIISNDEKAEISLNSEVGQGLLNATVKTENINNTYIIKVLAEDGTEKQYTLIINKKTNIEGNIITENINNIYNSNVIVYNTSDTRPEKEDINSIDSDNAYREIIAQVTTKNDGKFIIDLPSEGKFDILMVRNGYLEHRITGIEVSKGNIVTLEEYTLIAGDVVKSGEIEIDDLSIMNDKIGVIITNDNESDKIYDLNEDGIIDNFDKNILKKNYGKLSDNVEWINPETLSLATYSSSVSNESEFILPLKCDYTITSDYGYRVHPITDETKLHSGIDLSGTHHAEVYVVADGEVTYAGIQSGYGNCVEIKHSVNGETIYSFYAHLSEIDVIVGETIKQGSRLGLEGGDPNSDSNPGSSTGHHLHFELRSASGSGNSLNPNDYIKF